MMNIATIWLADKPSETNRSFLRSLFAKLEAINLRAGIKLNVKIATPKDRKMLTKHVKKLPAMKIDMKYFSEVRNILDELDKQIIKSKKMVKLKSEEEEMHDWTLKVMQTDVKEPLPSEDADDIGKTIAAQAMRVAEARKDAIRKPSSKSKSGPGTGIAGSIIKPPTATNLATEEGDELLSKLFEKGGTSD